MLHIAEYRCSRCKELFWWTYCWTAFGLRTSSRPRTNRWRPKVARSPWRLVSFARLRSTRNPTSKQHIIKIKSEHFPGSRIIFVPVKKSLFFRSTLELEQACPQRFDTPPKPESNSSAYRLQRSSGNHRPLRYIEICSSVWTHIAVGDTLFTNAQVCTIWKRPFQPPNQCWSEQLLWRDTV